MREANESAPVVNGWNNAALHSPTYTVKAGDTLYSIAWAFGLDYRNLAFNNHLTPPYQLVPGQKLDMVPRATPPITATSPVEELKPQQDLVVAPKIAVEAANPKSTISKAPELKPKAYPNVPVRTWIRPARGKIIRGFSALPLGNKGIDIKGTYGEPIVASAAGQVVYAGDGIRGYGNLVILKHNDNYLSAYAYNKTISVKEGTWVRQGETIGTMGRTDAGIVLLHFEIRRNGQAVNPLIYLSH
ncbi:MAG TPA: peptidoglycan DD-metalloendopeptidase family protein [Coxiellaceae bacterium]|nr:peptidoglycan DD-metalloendopeptidase family protein [Coxiellaceae bacterium]